MIPRRFYESISAVVESKSFCESTPLFFVYTSTTETDALAKAAAFSIALSGGNAVIIAGSRLDALRTTEYYGGEGLLEINKIDDGNIEVHLRTHGLKKRIFKSTDGKPSRPAEYKIGEITTCSTSTRAKH